MSDNDQSKIRYDDFVSKVQADPANPQATIMLAGFVGRGAEGQVRIYPDPTLGTWYDVPEADIVHSQPIADAKLGGSYVWIKSSAQIRPGGSGTAGAAQGQPQPQAMAGAAAQLQPTPTVQTHCFICPPLTQVQFCQVQSLHCPTQPVVCDIPPPTPATICTQIGCMPTPQTHCFICPPVTQATPCQVQSLHCPTHPVVCDTRPTIATLCTQIGCHTAPAACVHPTLLTQPIGFCPPTQPAVCGIVPPTLSPGCGPQQQGAQQAQPQAFAGPAQHPAPQAAFSQHVCPTPSAVQQCGQPPQTAATLCTQFGCGHTILHTQCICPTPTAIPTHQIVCLQTANIDCLPTVATACLHTVTTPCLQTVATPCLPITLGGCTPQSIACTPTPNGVFTPFGR